MKRLTCRLRAFTIQCLYVLVTLISSYSVQAFSEPAALASSSSPSRLLLRPFLILPPLSHTDASSFAGSKTGTVMVDLCSELYHFCRRPGLNIEKRVAAGVRWILKYRHGIEITNKMPCLLPGAFHDELLVMLDEE